MAGQSSGVRTAGSKDDKAPLMTSYGIKGIWKAIDKENKKGELKAKLKGKQKEQQK